MESSTATFRRIINSIFENPIMMMYITEPSRAELRAVAAMDTVFYGKALYIAFADGDAKADLTVNLIAQDEFQEDGVDGDLFRVYKGIEFLVNWPSYGASPVDIAIQRSQLVSKVCDLAKILEIWHKGTECRVPRANGFRR